MKKIIIILTITLISANMVNACEICGCGLGNYYIGMHPQFNKKFIGIRYQFRKFKTVMADDASQYSRDYFKTMELCGGWNFGKKWQVMAILPYHFIHQVSDDGVTNNQGPGDVAFLVNYKVFSRNSMSARHKMITQDFWLGTGIKLPTGKFKVDETELATVSMANMQTGTASTDFMVNGFYSISINKFGINSNTSYKINTSNSDKYVFGNKFSAATYVYYAANAGNMGILPNIGLMYEYSSANKIQKATVAETGGYWLGSSAGLDFSFKKITIGGNLQLPVSQHFASGQTKSILKGMFHVTYSF